MPRITLFLIGLLMITIEGFFILINPQPSPVWLQWLAGFFFWYVGFAVAIAGIWIVLAARLAAGEEQRSAKERLDTTTMVLHLGKFDNGNSPRGLVREIPAMGAFVY